MDKLEAIADFQNERPSRAKASGGEHSDTHSVEFDVREDEDIDELE